MSDMHLFFLPGMKRKGSRPGEKGRCKMSGLGWGSAWGGAAGDFGAAGTDVSLAHGSRPCSSLEGLESDLGSKPASPT